MNASFSKSTDQSNQYTYPGPDDIHRTRLENGIVVLSRTNHNSPSVVISGYLSAGAILDPEGKKGLGSFTAGGLMRGTEQREFHQIYDALESVGASLMIGAGVHTVTFNGRSLVEDLALLLDILRNSLRSPAFPADHIEILRGQILTGLAIRSQDTSDMAGIAFDEIVYPDHPYRDPAEGYTQTISEISRDDMINFHARNYGPADMTIAIVGAVEPEHAVDLVRQSLGDWMNPDQPALPVMPDLKPLDKVVRRKVMIPEKSQSSIVIGAAGPPRRSSDYLAAALGNSILGQFGMMGRIGEAVRKKAGLAYHASSHLSGGTGPGPWFITAGADPEHVELVIDLIFEQVERFAEEPISLEELEDCKSQFIGSLPLSLESNTGVAAALISLERFQLGLDYFNRFSTLIHAVQPADIQAAADRYLHPQRIAIAVAGV